MFFQILPVLANHDHRQGVELAARLGINSDGANSLT